ncbi:MAG TPA: choice-of-anchor Q domain-containing protein [Capillimicrobium sp.]|jgi:hypothetical protein
MRHRTIPVLCGAALAVAALPAAASAAQICVHTAATSCPAGAVDAGDSLQSAINTAWTNGGGGDAITVGPGTFTGPFMGGPGTEAIVITGAGAATKLTAPTVSGGTVFDGGGANMTLRDLSLAAGPEMIGFARVGLLERVAIAGYDGVGVRLPDTGRITESTIDVPSGYAVQSASGTDSAIVERSVLSADIGVSSRAADTRIRRTRMTVAEYGFLAHGTTARVSDTAIDATTANAEAVLASCMSGALSVVLTHVSTDGPVVADCDDPGWSSEVEVDSSIVQVPGTAADLCTEGENVSIASAYSSIGPDRCPSITGDDTESGIGDVTGASPLAGPSDLRALPGSAAIDRGRPAPAGPAFDVVGGHRSVDGDGDGAARPDMGAYELVPVPPAPGGGGGGGGGPVTPEVPSTDPAPVADPGPAPVAPVEPVTPPATVDVAALLRQMLASGERGAYALAFPEAGTLRVVWRTGKGRALARGTVRRPAAGPAELQVRLTKRGRRAARAGRRTRASARATFTASGRGTPVTATRSVRFARPGR